jgi:serine/threonine-protein phosphatase PP1 catalytic subunit
MSSAYGFESECIKRRSQAVYTAFSATFKCLPIACVLNSNVFCVHGGISPVLGFISELSSLSKPERIPKDGLIADMLWSDPQDGFPEWTRGRGIAHNFGHVALEGFFNRNGIRLLIRAHQPCHEGFQWAFRDRPECANKCLTVFSSANYCGMGNRAAVVRMDQAGNIGLTVFAPLTEEDREKKRVLFPSWLLEEWRGTQDPADSGEPTGSEPNVMPQG